MSRAENVKKIMTAATALNKAINAAADKDSVDVRPSWIYDTPAGKTGRHNLSLNVVDVAPAAPVIPPEPDSD